MSPVLTRPRPRSGPVLLRREVIAVVLAGAITVAAIAALHSMLQGPPFVDRVTIVNETPYLVDVEVAGVERDGWLQLGPVSQRGGHSFGGVVDQGDRWIFHVTTGAHDGGEFTLSKTELERADWRVPIPGELQRRLEASGAVPIRRQ
jgi:hypothetical protein